VCRSDNSCVAWTLTPGASGSSMSRCALKPVIPQQVVNACCSSGVERVPPADMRSETECIAWTYVRAGVVAGEARCALKSKTSQQVTSSCCISGTK
jgi:hypothetical protein